MLPVRLRFTFTALLCGLFLTMGSASAQQAITAAPNSSNAAPQQIYSDPTGDIVLQVDAGAPTVFSRASIQALSRSYIKLTGVDLADDRLIDDFALINYCDIYTRYFKDEFAWRQAREAFRRVVQRELETYPENIYILGTLSLGRYDFAKKAFLLNDNMKFNHTGLFRFFDRSYSCAADAVEQIPLSYQFRLNNPITLDSIPVPEDKARTITRIMEQENNAGRKIYLTFFLRINDFTTQSDGNNTSIRAITRSTLQSLRFYLDRQRKVLIYEYTGDK